MRVLHKYNRDALTAVYHRRLKKTSKNSGVNGVYFRNAVENAKCLSCHLDCNQEAVIFLETSSGLLMHIMLYLQPLSLAVTGFVTDKKCKRSFKPDARGTIGSFNHTIQQQKRVGI